MKNLILLFTLALFSFGIFAPQMAIAGASVPASADYGVVPGKVEKKKVLKKKLRKAAKKYKTETAGMTKAEKDAYLQDRVEKEDSVPRKKLLIVGIILFVAGWILSAVFWSSFGLAYLIGLAGTIILIIWLILWLMDEL